MIIPLSIPRHPEVKILLASDLHIGHNRLDPKAQHSNLRAFLYPLITEDLDALIIAGDYFHTLLRLCSEAAYVGLTIMMELDALCCANKVHLIVMEGTNEHDRGQLKHFKNTTALVVDKMDVVLVEPLGYVGFIPDDLPYTDIEESFISLVNELTPDRSVDFLVYHGYLLQEIPKNVPINPHHVLDLDKLVPYVKYAVLKGHIHTPAIYRSGSLVAVNNGSVEVMRHNEMSKKGCHLITVGADLRVKFIQNPRTHIYSSITMREEDPMGQLAEHLESLSKKCNDDRLYPVYIQIECSLSVRERLVPEALGFGWPAQYSYKFKKQDDVVVMETDIGAMVRSLPKITTESLPALIYERLANELTLERITEILNEEESQ